MELHAFVEEFNIVHFTHGIVVLVYLCLLTASNPEFYPRLGTQERRYAGCKMKGEDNEHKCDCAFVLSGAIWEFNDVVFVINIKILSLIE